jgi:hypothetical protein
MDPAAMTAVKDLDERTKELMRTGARPRRDRQDVSYQRPLTIDPARAKG